VIAAVDTARTLYDPLEAASAELLRAAAFFRLGKRALARRALLRYRGLAREHGFEQLAL
jgi:hypothetical protein